MTWTRAIGLGVGAVMLFAFTSVYRFNTLGGAFGGFDNDHFLNFAYAKQVQAGERPLEDLDDLALQGAWPYFTYSVSALAQERFGNTLRTEALVTIGAVALASAVTFVAASLVAPVVLAFVCASLFLFVGPTLYNYPKAVMLSGGALLIALYARCPSAARVACLSVLTAVAFVFRHDLAVYLCVGALAVFVAATSSWRAAGRQALLYGALTLVFVTPSLIYIQRYGGLVAHVRDSLDMSRSEAARTELSWPAFALSDAHQSAVAWLYYLVLSLPLVAVLLLWLTRSDGPVHARRVATLALAVMLMFTSFALLRSNVAVRIGDIGPLCAVVLACTVDMALRRWAREPAWRWLGRVGVTALALVATVLAVRNVGSVGSELERAGLSISVREARTRADHLWRELETLPATYWSDPHPTPFVRAVQYLNRCTAPGDRVLMMPYWPELLPLADRRFAGGRSSVLPGFLTTPLHQRRIVERWSRQSVPIALVDDEAIYDKAYRLAVPVVHAYLEEHYAFAGRVRVADTSTLRVFAHRARVPAGVFGDTGLPCFR